jgi:DNA repair protein SbcC/Rad50
MRPVLLELEGFGAFRDRTIVDFSDADQFALVGPTGAGKSTIIDAICFVLYGSVPRYDDHRLVGAAMTMGAAETRVRLRFTAGDDTYVAVRIVRRAGNGKVSTKEARLEREVPGSGADGDKVGALATVILAGRESEMSKAIDQILGLSFDDFTRCVVLPQGEFARFLHDKPADRQALLVRLLDLSLYQRLQSRATTRAAGLDHEIRFIDGQLSELGVATRDLAELQAEVKRLGTARQRIDDSVTEFDSLGRVVESATAEQARLRSLQRSLGQVQVPSDLAQRADQGAALSATVAAAEAELEAVGAHLASVQDTADRLGAPEQWDELLRLHDRLAKGTVVIEQRQLAALAARQAEVEAAEQVTLAEATVDASREALAQIERANRAHVLAVDLQPGEPCPVCEQVVGHLPLPVSPPGMDSARSELAAAESARARATAAAGDARVAAGTSAAALEQATTLLAEVVQLLAEAPDRDTVMEHLEASRSAVAALEAARRSDQQLRIAVKRAREAATEHQRDAEALAGSFHTQRDAVSALEPPSPGSDLAASWAALANWATTAQVTVEADLSRLAREVERGHSTMAALLAKLTADAFGGSGRPANNISSLRADIGVAVDRAERAVAVEEQRRERTAGLEAERVALSERRMVANDLARLLKADRFQRWLISATLAELAARASERLRTMSNNQFSLDLSENGEFAVIDHGAANELRPVRTLSGGETFQASLALALALAEGLAELSGKARRAMDSIFLDEGFGTLDAESLDIVASTIEELSHADGGRMVGVVTHVPALAERMPVRFRVSRDARTAKVEREVS